MQLTQFKKTLLIVLLLSILGYQFFIYLSYWNVYFNADIAMIGLMQKHVLQNGEVPIFVWKVGYMGMLLEGYLGALFQSWFGAGPFAANLPSALFLFLFLCGFFFLVNKYANTSVALITLLVLAVSSPWFYIMGMRAWPNYAETFFLGVCIWAAYLSIAKEIQAGDYKVGRFFLLGVLCGFAYYTSPLSVFYILPLLATVCWIYLKSSSPYLSFVNQLTRVWNPHREVRSIFWAKILRPLIILIWLNFGIGFFVFLFDWESIQIGMRLIKWQPMAIMLTSVYLFAAFFFFRMFSIWIWPNRNRFTSFIIFICGLGFGYAPAIYYRFFLHQGSSKGLSSLEGTFSDVLERFELFLRFNAEMFGVSDFTGMSLAFLFSVCALLFISVRLLLKRLSGSNRKFLLIPLSLMFPIIIVLFLANGTKGTLIITGRYLIFLMPLYALAIAVVLQRFTTSRFRSTLVGVALVIFTLSGFASQQKVLQANFGVEHFKSIIREMDSAGVRYGYADYWFAYPVNLMTGERIILEPLQSNYCPHYEPIVLAQDKIAYVDRVQSKIDFSSGRGTIRGRDYEVISRSLIGDGSVFLVLQSVKTKISQINE